MQIVYNSYLRMFVLMIDGHAVETMQLAEYAEVFGVEDASLAIVEEYRLRKER